MAARGMDTLQTTPDELAVELGTAREVVSRVLKEFEKEKAIELSRGKIKITDAGIMQKNSPNVTKSRNIFKICGILNVSKTERRDAL